MSLENLVAAGSGFFSQIHFAEAGSIQDFLITGADSSTGIAISADSAFFQAVECLLVYRDQKGVSQKIDLWPLMIAHFAAQIQMLGETTFGSIVADDIREFLLANGQGENTTASVDGLVAHLFAHTQSLGASLDPPSTNEKIPAIHWMQFTLTPLLLSPIPLGSVLQADQSPDTVFNPILLRFRHSFRNGPVSSGTPATNGRAAVLVTEGQFRRARIIKDLKQIRRQLGPMGVLQRSLLVPILETVCGIAENASEQQGET